MSQISFVDKLKTIVEVTSASPYFIGALIFLMILGIFLIKINKKNVTKYKIIYFLIYFICIGILIYSYGTSLQQLLDYLIDHLFILFYFPDLAAYLVAIIITNIILWKSIFSKNSNNSLKIINTCFYCFIHYLFVLILNIITKNNLDIFTPTSVYENKQAFALIELSSFLFIIWIGFLILFSTIKAFQNHKRIEEPISVEEFPPIENLPFVDNTSFEEEIEPIEEVVVIEEIPVYGEYQSPEISSLIGNIETEKKEKNINYIEAPQIVYRKNGISILEQMKPVIHSTNVFENLFSLEDYKLLLKLLKEEKEKEKPEEISSIAIEKENSIEFKKHINSNLTELQALYQN